MKMKNYISLTVMLIAMIMSYVVVKSINSDKKICYAIDNSSSSSNNSSSNTNSNDNTTSSNKYSESEVSKHNSKEDCWVILTTNSQSKVYNITEYVSNPEQHPGGDVIAPFCGKDITGPFLKGLEGGRVHSGSAESILSDYAIGDLER